MLSLDGPELKIADQKAFELFFTIMLKVKKRVNF